MLSHPLPALSNVATSNSDILCCFVFFLKSAHSTALARTEIPREKESVNDMRY